MHQSEQNQEHLKPCWRANCLRAVAAIQHFHDTLCPPAPSVTSVAGASTGAGVHTMRSETVLHMLLTCMVRQLDTQYQAA